MDEKTAELRDLFVETTGAEAVTDGQEESPGSLTGRDESAVAARLAELVAMMRDRYGFATDLDDDAYVHVARGHLTEDDSDDAIAAELGIDAETVRTARIDLHLVSDVDREVPFEFDRLKRILAEHVGHRAGTENAEADGTVESTEPVEDDETDEAAASVDDGAAADRAAVLAAELGVDAETVRRHLPVAHADRASTRANHRFRDEFRDLLTDAEIEGAYARDAREDGLRDATEDLETDVSL